MGYPIATNFVSIELSPEITGNGQTLFKASVTLESKIGPIPEQVTFTVAVKAGNRTIVEIHKEAINRAALILACVSGLGHPHPEDAVAAWGQLAEDLPRTQISQP